MPTKTEELLEQLDSLAQELEDVTKEINQHIPPELLDKANTLQKQYDKLSRFIKAFALQHGIKHSVVGERRQLIYIGSYQQIDKDKVDTYIEFAGLDRDTFYSDTKPYFQIRDTKEDK